MTSELIIASSTLIGTLIGGSITLLVNYIQQKNNSNRELLRIAYEMAVKEYDTLIKTQEGKTIMPLESFVSYYIKYLEVVKSKKFKIEDLKEFRKFNSELNQFYLKNQ